MEALFVLALYFVPAIIANRRGHLSASAIFALNLFLGWTVLGWIVALVWSLTGNTRSIQMALHGIQQPPGHRSLGDLVAALVVARREKRERRDAIRVAIEHRQLEFQRARQAEQDALPWKFEKLRDSHGEGK